MKGIINKGREGLEEGFPMFPYLLPTGAVPYHKIHPSVQRRAGKLTSRIGHGPFRRV